MRIFGISIISSIALLVVGWGLATLQVNNEEEAIRSTFKPALEKMAADPFNGEYVANMAGCIVCHTDTDNGGIKLAGGRTIVTPFGIFYSPNITSDSSAGIGEWTTSEFLNAMLFGRSPDNEHYYPSFPYTSYSAMTIQDLVDLKAWLDTVPPSSSTSPEHELAWPISIRPVMAVWKALYFDPRQATDRTDRGGYLVTGPGHCAECHAQRNWLGGTPDHALTGNSRGPDGGTVPGISAADLTEWAIEDLELFLEVGITPDGDFTGGHMTDVIEYSTGLLTVEDRTAMARFLLSTENTP